MFETHQMQDLINKAEGSNEPVQELLDRHYGERGRLSVKDGHGVNPPVKFYRYKESEYSITELAEMAGINQGTMRARINTGWPIEKAVEKPAQPSLQNRAAT